MISRAPLGARPPIAAAAMPRYRARYYVSIDATFTTSRAGRGVPACRRHFSAQLRLFSHAMPAALFADAEYDDFAAARYDGAEKFSAHLICLYARAAGHAASAIGAVAVYFDFRNAPPRVKAADSADTFGFDIWRSIEYGWRARRQRAPAIGTLLMVLLSSREYTSTYANIRRWRAVRCCAFFFINTRCARSWRLMLMPAPRRRFTGAATAVLGRRLCLLRGRAAISGAMPPLCRSGSVGFGVC